MANGNGKFLSDGVINEKAEINITRDEIFLLAITGGRFIILQ